MTTTTTPATDALNRMYALQTKLAAQTCPHCHHQSIVYVTAKSCHCTNQGCDGKYITLPVAEFMALTADQLASYQRGHTNVAALEAPHKERTAEIERVVLAAAARAAARDGSETVCG